MPKPLDVVRSRVAGFFTNLDGGPPWPRKAVPLVRNRVQALRRGCCGHPGEPGC